MNSGTLQVYGQGCGEPMRLMVCDVSANKVPLVFKIVLSHSFDTTKMPSSSGKLMAFVAINRQFDVAVMSLIITLLVHYAVNICMIRQKYNHNNFIVKKKNTTIHTLHYSMFMSRSANGYPPVLQH